MSEKNVVRFASAIFCNSASTEDSGKINCRGIFTSFLVWAYPSSVKFWHAIVTIYNLPLATSSISVSISYGKSKKTTLATVDVESPDRDFGSILNIPISYQFNREGYYTVHFNLIGTTKTLKIPVKVFTQAWPKFSEKEIEYLKKNPTKIGPIRANIICSDCSQPYIFEDILFPDYKIAHGVHPFPDSGEFECDTCGRILNLKDIQGQIRSSIRIAVTSALKGGI